MKVVVIIGASLLCIHVAQAMNQDNLEIIRSHSRYIFSPEEQVIINAEMPFASEEKISGQYMPKSFRKKMTIDAGLFGLISVFGWGTYAVLSCASSDSCAAQQVPIAGVAVLTTAVSAALWSCCSRMHLKFDKKRFSQALDELEISG